MASSSSYFGRWKYDVFLSFRGETRDDFTAFLHYALIKKKIKTFIDEKLEKGKDLQVLLEAIEASPISVIIFSEDFAGSTWCLDEVVKIVECKQRWGHTVFPVFLLKDPSDATKDDGNFAAAIADHERKAKEKNDQEILDKIPQWKVALKIATKQCGWDSKNTGPKPKLVDEIVEAIEGKLNKISPSIEDKNLIGIKRRIEIVNSLLSDELVLLVGICGIGGVGKTTLAKAVFKQFSKDFEGCCFIDNIRMNIEKHGQNHLKKEMYSKILKEDAETLDLEKEFVRGRLKSTRVLIVLDDVTDESMIDDLLLSGRSSFGSGSKIIITSRYVDLCRNATDKIYEVEDLNFDESLQLFSVYAFKKDEPPAKWLGKTKTVLDCCKRNPLAIKVMGSSLLRKDEKYWSRTLVELENYPKPEIHNVLKVSYDGLSNEEKKIFLDIACFFRGWERDTVTEILECNDTSAYIRITHLIEKSLISISNDHEFEMHDLIQEMGWNIVRMEENGSRLWNSKHICDVLRYKKGTNATEGIVNSDITSFTLHLQSDSFKGMDRLKLLIFKGCGKYEFQSVDALQHCELSSLPDELRYLDWDFFPFKFWPSNFNAENLLKLVLRYGKGEKLWTGVQSFPKLKHIDLEDSELTEFPDLSEAKNIEYINLSRCIKLVELPSSVQRLKKLKHLNLYCCMKLRILPNSFESTVLRFLNLKFFSNVVKCPEMFGNLEVLNLYGTNIEVLPQSIANLKFLRVLNLDGCSNLTELPDLPCSIKELNLGDVAMKEFPQSFHKQKLLGSLHLYCSNLTTILNLPSSIKELSIDGAQITEVPSSIERLIELAELKLQRCQKLRCVSRKISKVKSLRLLHVYDCQSLESFPEILEPMDALIHLTIYGCGNFKRLPMSIYFLKSLKDLNLAGSAVEELPSSLEQLHCLESLCLNYCEQLVSLPIGIHKLSNCIRISIEHCKSLRSLPELPQSLEQLWASDCISLETLSINSKCNFFDVDFSNCFRLNPMERFIAEDTQRQIQVMESKLPKDRHQIKLLFPGSEIPRWFADQSLGSFTTINFPAKSQLKGITFCFVLAFNRNVNVNVLNMHNYHYSIECQCRFEADDNEHMAEVLTWEIDFLFKWGTSDHVIVCYEPLSKTLVSKFAGNNPSVKFNLMFKGKITKDLIVKKCAILVL